MGGGGGGAGASGRGRRVRAFGAVRARARTSGDFWVVCMASSSNALVSADRTFEEPSREGAAEAPREAMAAMVDGRCAEGAFRVPARDRACDASGGRGGILSGASAIGPRRIGTSPRERRAATRGARSGAARRARFFHPVAKPTCARSRQALALCAGPGGARDGARRRRARTRDRVGRARAGTYGRLGGDRKASPGALRSARAGARARAEAEPGSMSVAHALHAFSHPDQNVPRSLSTPPVTLPTPPPIPEPSNDGSRGNAGREKRVGKGARSVHRHGKAPSAPRKKCGRIRSADRSRRRLNGTIDF